MASWLLQSNESHWRIGDFFADGRTGTAWPIRQHWKRMSPGDGVAVWHSGEGGAVVALGTVTAEPFHGTAEDEYRIGGGDDKQWLVPIELTRNLLGQPVRRAALEHDPRFANALILRMRGGRNPFPLEPDEWSAINDRVLPPGPHPVATAVRGAAVVVAVGATAVREAFKSVIS